MIAAIRKQFPDWEFWVAFASVIAAAVLSVAGIAGALLGAYHWQWMPLALYALVAVFAAMAVISEIG